MKQESRWAWDTMPDDGGPPRRVYIGNMSDWDISETRRRSSGNFHPWGGVWTNPINPGAKKAKWGKTTFDSGRYRCCEDLEHCGVYVAVRQGPEKPWNFQRQWKNGFNSMYQKRCKNHENYSGISRFHHIVVNQIYSILKIQGELNGKKISKLPPPEIPIKELAGKKPDVYVKFDDGTFFAIEVVYTHPPTEEVHNLYGENMVDIRLKELAEIEDDEVFGDWIQHNGVQILLEKESEILQRKKRFEDRQKVIQVRKDKEWRELIAKKISKCEQEFGFRFKRSGGENEISFLNEIEDWFEEENSRRQKENAIKKAIEDNVRKYGEKLEHNLEDFESREEVDSFYKKTFDEKRKNQEKARIDWINSAKMNLEKELDIQIQENFQTIEEFNEYASFKRNERDLKLLKEKIEPELKQLEKNLNIKVEQEFASYEQFQIFKRTKELEDELKMSIDAGDFDSLNSVEIFLKLIRKRSKLIDNWQNQIKQLKQNMNKSKLADLRLIVKRYRTDSGSLTFKIDRFPPEHIMSNGEQITRERDSELVRIVNDHCKKRYHHDCIKLPEDERLVELVRQINALYEEPAKSENQNFPNNPIKRQKKLGDDSDTSIDEEIKSLSGPELSSKLIEERSKLVDHWRNQFEQLEQKMDRQKLGELCLLLKRHSNELVFQYDSSTSDKHMMSNGTFNSKQEKDSELLRIVNVHCKDRTNHICAELPEDEHLEELFCEVNNLINDSKSKITSTKNNLYQLRKKLERLEREYETQAMGPKAKTKANEEMRQIIRQIKQLENDNNNEKNE